NLPRMPATAQIYTQIYKLAQQSFAGFVAGELTIVRVGTGIGPHFDDVVGRYFLAEYGQIKLGYLDRNGILAYDTWARKHLGQASGGTDGQLVPVPGPDGYYLFRKGTRLGFHPGELGARAVN